MMSFDEFMNRMSNPDKFEPMDNYTKPTYLRWQELTEDQKNAADLRHILAHPELYDDDGEEVDEPLPEFVVNSKDIAFLASCGWAA